MTKNQTILFIIISLFIGGFIYLNNSLQTPIINLTYEIKSFYINKKDNISHSIDEHFNQTEIIKQLTHDNEKYKKELLSLKLVSKNYNQLLRENNATLASQPNISLVKAISYIKFADYNKVYIDADNLEKNRAYGLLKNNTTAGIAMLNNSKSIALLNSDPKCTYSVYIGENMAPSIIRGNNSNMIGEYIPAYIEIKVGDIVQTSGLDNIFTFGIVVGKVVSISKVSGYQRAIIKPYYSGKNPTYFYLIH